MRRVAAALAHLPDVASKKKGKAEEKKEKARVSTTDPEARVMKMADGGFWPAFNGQFATDTESLVIVGVDVSNSGRDAGKQVYKDRAATAECANADARNHGLQRFTVRGEKKTRCVLLLHALAHNVMRVVSLRTQLRCGSPSPADASA